MARPRIHTPEEYHRLTLLGNAARKRRLVEAGICYVCAKRKAILGKKCLKCAKIEAIRAKNYRKRVKAAKNG